MQGSYFRKSRRFTKRKKDNGRFRNGKKTEVDKNCGRASLRYPAVVYILKRIRRKDDIENRICGYIRVSTREQNEGRQVIALHEAGVDTRYIYMNKQSGKNFERPQYKKMLRKMRSGDLLYAKSIDRLGRNYEEMLRQWRLLVEEKQVDVQVLDMPLLDTRRRNSATTALADKRKRY